MPARMSELPRPIPPQVPHGTNNGAPRLPDWGPPTGPRFDGPAPGDTTIGEANGVLSGASPIVELRSRSPDQGLPTPRRVRRTVPGRMERSLPPLKAMDGINTGRLVSHDVVKMSGPIGRIMDRIDRAVLNRRKSLDPEVQSRFNRLMESKAGRGAIEAVLALGMGLMVTGVFPTRGKQLMKE